MMNSATRRPISKGGSLLIPGVLLLAVTIFTGPKQARADTIFSDNFTSSTLDPAWQVLPGYGRYTVGGGDLRYFDNGPTASTTGWNNSALTLALPFTGTNWEFDTKATYHLNWLLPGYGSYTGPAVPTANGSAGAQAPEVLVKFDPGTAGTNYAGTDYALFERNIDAYYGGNTLTAQYGTTSSSNLLNPADSNINNNVADGTYWLQIIRDGGQLTMNYSYDGTNYQTALSTTLANPTGTYNELMLGGLTYLSNSSYTDYSYVNVTGPGSAVPEPGGFGLLGFSLAILAFLCFLRKAQLPMGGN